MAVTIVIRSTAGTPMPQATFDLPRIVLGRGEGCDLRLPDPSVSHRHASIRQRGTDYIVLDEGSTNGTYIGNVRLPAQAPRVLRNGDLIRLGRVWLQVRLEPMALNVSTAQQTRELAVALVAQAMQAQGMACAPRLVVVEGPDQGKHVELDPKGKPVTIGRAADADLRLDVQGASRHHARVSMQADHALVRDMSSTQGTWLGDAPIEADRDTILRPGDSFRIGPDIIALQHPAAEALRELQQLEDEPMDQSEVLEPAGAAETANDQPSVAAPAASRPSSAPASPSRPPGPVRAPVPAKRSGKASSGGWDKTDVLIVLLALAVLGVSAVGLLWLFQGS